MFLIAVEAVLMGSKPPAAAGVRISPSERHSFGASALLSTRALSLNIRKAGGSAFMPKLIKLVGPLATGAEELSPFIAYLL